MSRERFDMAVVLIDPYDDAEAYAGCLEEIHADRCYSLPRLVDNACELVRTRYFRESFADRLKEFPGYLSAGSARRASGA